MSLPNRGGCSGERGAVRWNPSQCHRFSARDTHRETGPSTPTGVSSNGALRHSRTVRPSSRFSSCSRSLVRFAPYASCWHLWLVLRDSSMFLLRRCSALHLRRPQQPPTPALRKLAWCTRPRPLSQHPRLISTRAAGDSSQQRKVSGWIVAPVSLLLLGGAGVLVYEYNQPFRHTVLAVVRCSRVAGLCMSYTCCI